MKVLTDEDLRTWVEENVVKDWEVYWPEDAIRAFESHVLETYEKTGPLIERPVGTKNDGARPEGFIRERDLLLMPKGDQTARGLAEELVRLMELLAIHGSTGIGAEPDTRQAYVDTLVARIDSLITLPRPIDV